MAPTSTTVTPSAAGTDVYSLTCANAAEASPVASVNLMVTAAPGHSGGGALDGLALLGLVGFAGARFFRQRPRVLI